MLREEIRQKKTFTLRILRREFNSRKVSLQNNLILIDFARVSTFFEIVGNMLK